MLVEEIMTRDALACTEQQTLSEAAQQMWEGDIGAVAVVNEEGVPTGMITDRDICMAGYTQGTPLSEIPLASAMSKNLITVSAYTEVNVAQKLMGDNQVRRLPVVDEVGKLVGIVTLTDVAQRAGRGRSDVPAREVAETLKEVSRPRWMAKPGPASTGQ